jgi:predicted TIM-barrel fold metal-dependent hydrolase
MPLQTDGAIDCDIHPAVPDIAALLPYLSDHWRDAVLQRGIHDLENTSYPPGTPLAARPDWRPESGKPGEALERLQREALDGFGVALAICNCLYGVQVLYSEDMAAGFARAVNDWMAREWLDREPRLRASIVVAPQSPELAVDEIERCAADPRFVQVLLLAGMDAPLGQRRFWPIYQAAERLGLPIGIHAGSAWRHPPTAVGWPSYYAETYVANAPAFQSQLISLVCEGALGRFPGLRVVLLESGVTWLPAFMWRLTKFWRGLRMEIPWVDRPPTEIIRDQIRLTTQPFDAPEEPGLVGRLIEQIGSDEMLLFATDYPHWQFDGQDVLPQGLPAGLARRIMVDNPRATYARLRETVA